MEKEKERNEVNPQACSITRRELFPLLFPSTSNSSAALLVSSLCADFESFLSSTCCKNFKKNVRDGFIFLSYISKFCNLPLRFVLVVNKLLPFIIIVAFMKTSS